MDELVKVKMVGTGEITEMPFRRAVSYLSRGMAVHVTEDDLKPEKKSKPKKSEQVEAERDDEDKAFFGETTLSAPDRVEDDAVQEGENAENEPLTDE